MIKKFLVFSIVPALYLMNPALEINVVEAQQEEMGAQQESQQAATTAHTLMTGTFLEGAEAFADGLEQQVKADVPLSNKDVQKHLQIYTKHVNSDLRGAMTHLEHLQNTMTRRPAGEQQTERKNMDALMQVRQSITQAMNTTQQMMQQMRGQNVTKQKMQEWVSQLNKQIKRAMDQHEDLSEKFGVDWS